MKNIFKGLILGLLILLANIGIAKWTIEMIPSIYHVITTSSGWLAICGFFILLISVIITIFFTAFQGCILLSICSENTILKKNLAESNQTQSSNNEIKENIEDYDYIKYP